VNQLASVIVHGRKTARALGKIVMKMDVFQVLDIVIVKLLVNVIGHGKRSAPVLLMLPQRHQPSLWATTEMNMDVFLVLDTAIV
jgi:hypothetical protein